MLHETASVGGAADLIETEVAPDHDLWPDIENAIAEPSRTRWNTMFAQAASSDKKGPDA